MKRPPLDSDAIYLVELLPNRTDYSPSTYIYGRDVAYTDDGAWVHLKAPMSLESVWRRPPGWWRDPNDIIEYYMLGRREEVWPTGQVAFRRTDHRAQTYEAAVEKADRRAAEWIARNPQTPSVKAGWWRRLFAAETKP